MPVWKKPMLAVAVIVAGDSTAVGPEAVIWPAAKAGPAATTAGPAATSRSAAPASRRTTRAGPDPTGWSARPRIVRRAERPITRTTLPVRRRSGQVVPDGPPDRPG